MTHSSFLWGRHRASSLYGRYPRLIDMCAVTHSHATDDSFICVPWLIRCFVTQDTQQSSHVTHDSLICVPWLIRCFVTQDTRQSSHVTHDSLICVPWLIRCFVTQDTRQSQQIVRNQKTQNIQQKDSRHKKQRHAIHMDQSCTANCVWSVVFLFSNLNRWSGSLGLFYHVPLKRDLGDWEWILR